MTDQMAEDTKGCGGQSCIVQLVRDDDGTWRCHLKEAKGKRVVAFHVGIGFVSTGEVMWLE